MKRTPLRRRAQLRARTTLQRRTPLQRTQSLAATDAQREAVAGRPCIVCGATHRSDPAHLIPRSLGGCGDPTCVVPLCRSCHRAYDSGELDLLSHLEPAWRAQLAHAAGHVGLIGALRRIAATRTTEVVVVPDSVAGAGGVSFAGVSERRSATNAKPVEDRDGIWARNERIRLAELRADSERPMGELLEEGVELSRFADELADTARPGA
jgi:hypothetical protein